MSGISAAQSLSGKIAIVTGASSGIGEATSLLFAAHGAQVVLVARRSNGLSKVADEIARSGGVAYPIPADVTKEPDRRRIIYETVQLFGGIDILVNAAGIIGSGTIETTTVEQWDTMMEVNLRSVFRLIQLALPFLVERQGNVINVSSVTGIRAFPGVLAYAVSKAGLDQLTRCVALELAPKKVRVNAVNPGVVRTNLHRSGGMSEDEYKQFLEHSQSTHPLGRVGNPEEVASLIAFLASDEAAWITGVSYSIDGGRAQTCLR